MNLSGFLNDVARRCGERAIVEDDGAIERASVEFWGRIRGRAAALIEPATTEDVASALEAASAHGVAIVPQGGNTGLVGGGVPDASGAQVVLSLRRMRKVRSIDPVGLSMIVEAGVTLAEARAAAEEAGRSFPLMIGSAGSCTIGGVLATNAGGNEVLKFGMARAQALGLEVVLANGAIWSGLRTLRKNNAGFDLKQVFIGSEGALGVITAAALALAPAHRETATAWLATPSPDAALALLELARRELGEAVCSFELISGAGVEAARERADLPTPPIGPAPWHVLLEAGWTIEGDLAGRLERFAELAFENELASDGALADSLERRARFWALREAQSEATRRLGIIVRNDVSVDVAKTPELVRRIADALPEIAPPGSTFAPFGHMGDGNLHANIALAIGPEGAEEAIEKASAAVADIAIALGGSFSAEHGVGRTKRSMLERAVSPTELALMRQLKSALDPAGTLNPGVVV